MHILSQGWHELSAAEGEGLRVLALGWKGAAERGHRGAAHVLLRVEAAAEPRRDELLEMRPELAARLLREQVERHAGLLAHLPGGVVGKPREDQRPVWKQRPSPERAACRNRLSQLGESLELGLRRLLPELAKQQGRVRVERLPT